MLVWCQVTCCVAGSDCRQLFFGCQSGVISVFRTKYNPHKVGLLYLPVTYVTSDDDLLVNIAFLSASEQ